MDAPLDKLDVGWTRFSVASVFSLVVALPVAFLSAKTLLIVAPMGAVASGFVFVPKSESRLVLAIAADIPVIASCILLSVLLGAARLRVGILISVLIPLAIVGWSYYVGPMTEAVWHLPFCVAIVPCWLAVYFGFQASFRLTGNRTSGWFMAFRCCVISVVAFLAVSHRYWWELCWGV